jgi:hypothetical protein
LCGAAAGPVLSSPTYLHRARNLVQRFFNKIKQCRRIATRYDKLAANYLAFIKLASIRLWLRTYESMPKAENAPFDFKDILKARGYRWNDGSDGRPRSWWSDLQPDALEGELAFLRAEIFQYDADTPVRRVTAVDRFSDRA